MEENQSEEVAETQPDPIGQQAESAGVDPALLMQLLNNPEMVKLLKGLAAAMGN